MEPRLAASVLGLAVVGMLTGCAGAVEQPATKGATEPSWTPPPSVSAPARLEPDGTVPWVDERADFREFALPPAPRRTPPPADGPPCKAADLRGELASWIHKSAKDDGEADAVRDASLFGYVTVTNHGRSSCTLQGEVNTRLRDAGGEVPISYSHGISDEARERTIGVPPKQHANLRLDWSAPFCGSLRGTLTLHIELPHDGGTLTAPVHDDAQPGCVGGGDTQPDLASNLYSSGFDYGPAPEFGAPPAPALAKLRVSLAAHPTSGAPGEPLRYVVLLTNPTDQPVALTGPVGFSQFLTSRGMPGVEPFQIATAYRLNRRVITEIAAHQSVRYAMVPPALAQLRPGLKVTITWKLLAPGLDTTAPAASYEVTIS